MPSCKKKVYRTMCEKPNGDRTGGTRKVRYSSKPKRTRRARK